MNLFSLAFAQEGQESFYSSLAGFVPLLVVFAIFYFLVIRPQKQKIASHKKMINELKVGEKIITSGGIIGVIFKINEKNTFLSLEICENVVIKLEKNFVAEKIKKIK